MASKLNEGSEFTIPFKKLDRTDIIYRYVSLGVLRY